MISNIKRVLLPSYLILKTMCLYPKLILNRKYLPTKKNKFSPPPLLDQRLKYVPVGCGQCIECRKQKAQAWRIRLLEEIKCHKYNYFVTLTFSNEELEKLTKEFNLTECNALAAHAVRRFLERVRKKTKNSLLHWFITELGHENTERIHLHGLIFTEEPITNEWLQNTWKYGITDNGKYVNERTVNYIIKYCTKIDEDHKGFVPIILCSSGLGKEYIKNSSRNDFAGKFTNETYVVGTGQRMNLPIYYRNKIYTEEQREALWINKIEEHKRYILGSPIYNIDTADGERLYNDILKTAQDYNRLLGYGDDTRAWQKRDYNITLRMINKEEKGQRSRAHACRK